MQLILPKIYIVHKTILEIPSKSHKRSFGKHPLIGNYWVILEKKVSFPTSKKHIVHVFWRGVLEGNIGYPILVWQKVS
jgi:hypothetical protein